MGCDDVLFVLTTEFGVVLVPASEDLHGYYVQTDISHLYKSNNIISIAEVFSKLRIKSQILE